MPCSIVEQGIFLLSLDDICNIGKPVINVSQPDNILKNAKIFHIVKTYCILIKI